MSTYATIACQFCDTPNRVDVSRHADRPKCAQCGKPILLDRPLKVSEAHFDRTVLGAEVPVLVDFYADWCNPCRMMAPLIDEIAREKAGELLVVKLDTDQAPAISRRYGVRGIPFFGRFEQGMMVKTAVGAVGREGLLPLMDGAMRAAE